MSNRKACPTVLQLLTGCKTEWFLLWHLKTQLPLPQQVSCSSAEGLVIQAEGGTLLKAGGAETKGLGRGKGMTNRPWGECQNHKSNLSLTPRSYKVYLHFHIASTTFKMSMFRHFKAA